MAVPFDIFAYKVIVAANLQVSTKLFCAVPIEVIFKFRTIFSHLGMTRTKA